MISDMSGNISKTSQELRVLAELQNANGAWISSDYFIREKYLTQIHRAIFNLENRREKYQYEGNIEHSDFVNEYGFKSYRLKIAPNEQLSFFQPRLVGSGIGFNPPK